MTKEEKADFAQLLNMHVSAGQLDALDVQILKNVRNPKVSAARLRLMLMTKSCCGYFTLQNTTFKKHA